MLIPVPVAPRRVGVLGGMGPEATVMLMTRIIARTPAEDDADHVPLIVDNNTAVPSRIKAIIEGRGEDPAPVLATMAKRLEAAGAEALAMPCNTAHYYAPAIMAATPLPFLHMVELTAERIAGMVPAPHRVGLLGSPALKIIGLYDRVFAARGIDAIYPVDQDAMLRAIRMIKANGDDASARKILGDAARELRDQGAGVLLIACTEFSIITDAVAGTLPLVDSMDVLVDAIIAFANTSHPAT